MAKIHAMSDTSTVSYSDIKRKGSDFTFTGKLADFAVNDEWTGAYSEHKNGNSDKNGLSTLWKTIDVGGESVGNEIYRNILNYIDEIGNIDTCSLEKLKEYGSILGVESELLDENISFPIEIKNLVDIFSVNRAYLYNKATDGSEDTLVLTNTILHNSTVENLLDSLKNSDRYKKLIQDCIYNTLMEFINLKNVTFTDKMNGIETCEIWRTDIDRFANNLWSDDVESDDDIFKLKKQLSVSKSFTEKIYADDIIAGKRKLTDFIESEQIVIQRELDNRKGRYGDANSMRYYYMRLYKVLEYFRFCSTIYNSVYELSSYDLDDNKYTVSSISEDSSILTYNYNEYEVNDSLIRKVSEWVTDYAIGLSKLRTEMKSKCQKNTMNGTKRLMIDVIRKYIIDAIGTDMWNTSKKSILKKANLNTNFDIDVIQYTDTTDYFNIENANDTTNRQEHTFRPRYWENYNDLNNALDNEDVLKFFNRISEDKNKFTSNIDDGSGSDSNLYEFLSVLFEMGATTNVASDKNTVSDTKMSIGANALTTVSSTSADQKTQEVIEKFSGDDNIGSAPYANDKNTYHPSYQVLPFIQAFEEYNDTYTSIANLVNSYTENINESVSRLTKRLDALGNTINFWHYWNDDFTGYTTNCEKMTEDKGCDRFIDSPFDFNALNEFINYGDEYIHNLMNGINKYYLNSSTGKSFLDSDEVNTEIGRLQRYRDKIKAVAEREIYRYGKDYYGNIYILYKNKGCRTERDALGDIWIRLKDHPIAFPLFDIASSPSRFNSLSCMSDTDNTKLVDILNTFITHFNRTYGKNNIDGDVSDGNIIPKNISLSYGTYSNSLPITTNSRGTSSDAVFSYSYKDFNIEGNPKLVLSFTTNSKLNNAINDLAYGAVYDATGIETISDVITSFYYVDSVTNRIVETDDYSTFTVYAENKSGELAVVPNQTGRMIDVPDETYFSAEYDNEKKTFVITSNNSVINNELFFAEFSDDNTVDDGITYYCKDLSNTHSELHPCTKRTIILKKLFKLHSSSLSGTSDSDGNVQFNTEECSSKDTFISTESASSIVDGGLVYEDFDSYTYYVREGTSGTKIVDSSSIVIIGGDNPYYAYYDSNDVLQLKQAWVSGGTYEGDHYSFGDNIYRSYIRSEYLSTYPVSDCVFDTVYNDNYADTIGQFHLRENPYKSYHPYSVIDGEPFREATGGNGNPTGKVTIRDKFGNDNVFYYNLSSFSEDNRNCHIGIKQLKYDRYFRTLNLTSSKFNGEFELESNDNSEYSITLSFNSSSTDNLAQYSSTSFLQNQRKFFDFGFSYNQKMFYLSYYNGSMKYSDSGVLFGKLTETHDNKYNAKISFYRDSNHNVEYVDPSSMSIGKSDTKSLSKMFHIGDCTSKKGILSAFGRYYNPTNSIDGKRYLEITIKNICDDDIIDNKFNVPLKYDLYEFDDGTYSMKLNCTETRAYISLTTVVPSDDDIIANTIDQSSIGLFGSTRFSEIKNTCGDCTITILSFDITDNERFVFVDDEVRYMMECGKYGSFSQFSGFDGKNNVFANERLSADTDFVFENKTKPVTTDSSSITFYEKLCGKVDVTDNADFSNPLGKFINIYPSNLQSTLSNELTGVVISDSNEYGYVANIGDGGGNCIKFKNFDNKKIYDMSRGLGSGVMFFSDGDDTDTRVGAFYDGTDAANPRIVNGLKMIKVPVQSEVEGYYSTDFTVIEDCDDGAYALCDEGGSIARIKINDRGDRMVPLSGIVRFEYIPNGIVNTYEDLISSSYKDGTVIKVKESSENYPADSVFKKTGDGWEYLETSNVKDSEVTTSIKMGTKVFKSGYENSSENGNTTSFAAFNGDYITYFGVYDGSVVEVCSPKIVQKFTYASIPFFSSGIPYLIEYDTKIDKNGVITVRYSVFKIEKDGTKNRVHYLHFDYRDPIIGFVNTFEENNKLLYTRNGGVYLYTLGEDEPELAHTFDGISEEIQLENYRMTTYMHECENYILATYYVEGLGKCGLLHVRKNTPTSKATASVIYDVNGNKLNSVNITKMLSLKDIVLIEDSETGFIYKSKDDGLTFNVVRESYENKMTLAGCGTSKFYARYENNEKSYSYDGDIWYNVIGLPFSNWQIFNASKIDYLACREFDSDVSQGIVDKNVYVDIVKQYDFEDGKKFDGIKRHNGTLVCYRGMNGKESFEICRIDSNLENPEYYTFESCRGFAYSRSEDFGTDILFAPEGGMMVMKITDAFKYDTEPTVSYIDITESTNNSVNSFGGFENVCGRLLMYPSNGDRILSYNSVTNSFCNFYSFGSEMNFSDMDSIDGDTESDAIITSKYIGSDGNIVFYKTNFSNCDNYGIVEIDSGFPIMVTYGKYQTQFTYTGRKYDMYSITFTFMNDMNRKSVTIMSNVGLDDSEGENIRKIVEEERTKSALYVSGNGSVCYRFTSEDNSLKYRIEKIFKKNAAQTAETDFFEVTYGLQSIADRNAISFNYNLSEGSDGAVSVYRNFDNSQYVIRLKDTDITTQTTFKLRVTEDMLVDGKVDFILRVTFSKANNIPKSKCVIYWGDGETYDDVRTSQTGTGYIDGYIVKDGNKHSYIHSYYSSGEFYVTIGDGLKWFACGDETIRPTDVSRSLVLQAITYSDAGTFTSAEESFYGCENLVGPIPKWGKNIEVARRTYCGCKSLVESKIPLWNNKMTDISECYDGCIGIG